MGHMKQTLSSVKTSPTMMNFCQTNKKNSFSILKNYSALCLISASTFGLTFQAGAATGKIFDFDTTLPLMAIQILALTVFLDKTWFSPVGKVLDERQATIRARLGAAATGVEELDALQKEAKAVLKDARIDAQVLI